MEKRKNNHKTIGRLNAKWVLLFSCALFMTIMITFGITMAYFGGRSNGLTGQFTLKSGIVFDKSATDNQKLEIQSEYLVPGTSIDTLCVITISSKATENYGQLAVNGLFRAGFSFSGDMKDFVALNTGVVDVYSGATEVDMIDANKVARLILAADGYWYMVDGTTATTVEDSTLLYDIPCKDSGRVSLVFKMPIQVNNVSSVDSNIQFVNAHFGKKVSLDANFKVIQSEFYKDTATPLEKNYKNALEVFASN